MKFFLISFIIFTHVFLLCYRFKVNVPIEHKQKPQKLRLKLKKSRSLKKTFKSKELFKKLGQLSTQLSNPIESYALGDGSDSSALGEIYARIESTLTYPSLLQKINQTGVIKAGLYFSNEGEYIESKSKIEGVNFLKVSVARDLRRSFASNLKTIQKSQNHIYILCFFKFRLSINSNLLDESKMMTNSLYFYREGRGGTRTQDTVAKAVFAIFNPLSLLSLLPESKSAKMRMHHELDMYKKDLAW